MIELRPPTELLRRFCAPADHPNELYRGIILQKDLKGDLTQSWEDRKRLEIGEEAYAHLNWDTVVTNGRVMLRVESWRHPEGVETKFGQWNPPAEWGWAMDCVRNRTDVRDASEEDIQRIPEDVRESLNVLPGLAFVEVLCLRVWSYGRRGKPKPKICPSPEGLLYFRFDGGVGMCVASPKGKGVGKKKRHQKKEGAAV